MEYPTNNPSAAGVLARDLLPQLGSPPGTFDVGSATGRREMVARLLERLPNELVRCRPYTDEIVREVIRVVREGDRPVALGWPPGQPERVFDELLRRAVVDTASRPIPVEAQAAVEFLHAFLAELGRAGDADRARLADQQLLVRKILRALYYDLPYRGLLRFVGGHGRHVRLAEMLAQDYSLIRGAEHRRDAMAMLASLVEKVPGHYADPFILDRLLVFRKMNLDGIETHAPVE